MVKIFSFNHIHFTDTFSLLPKYNLQFALYNKIEFFIKRHRLTIFILFTLHGILNNGSNYQYTLFIYLCAVTSECIPLNTLIRE